MFCVGDYVVHRNSGICKIKEIAPLDLGNGIRNQEYYFLIPINERGSEIFSPAEDTNQNLRPVMSEEEAWKLINEIPSIEDDNIENDKLREAHYKEAIRSCDCKELVKIIKTLYQRRSKRIAEGKKSTASEERYFKMAEENLYSELAFAIGKEKSEMQELIASRVEK